ncbi:hypothetical protein [Azohydromonas caseinilytica]|uniref:Uncharacterized protein n=1 Tax=Azohydromonas caseinilytica TaxID=2728836 RepID=A0A848FGG4_9BURK|nr:hypothetical protein [Azohydromonas caseinilytica]NML18352.1 hypothetical protein [Azohydromonas caseinilytica]
MRFLFHRAFTRCIARLMAWVLLLGWFAGAANACVLLERGQQAPQLMATHEHEHEPGVLAHSHEHGEAGLAATDDGHSHDGLPGQQACKHLCDGERHAVVKAGTGELPWLDCIASATAASCLVLPALAPVRVLRPDAATLPAPPPIAIAFLRLTI